MSIDHYTSKICNNECTVMFCDGESLLSFLSLQRCAYKKCIDLLRTFGTLLEDLKTRMFSKYDNDASIKAIINRSIIVLYSNLLVALTTSYKRKQLFNLSITSSTIPGYKLVARNRQRDCVQNISYKINSFRLQLNTDLDLNMIKWVHNDNCNLPEHILFIGKLRTYECTIDILNEYILSVNLAIDKLKIYELVYIALIKSCTQSIMIK